MGSYRDTAKGFGQARLSVVEGDIATGVTQVPYDPTSLFMAAAIAQINQKLDSIQGSIDEMFEYMRQRDKANVAISRRSQISSTVTASNCGDATYMANAHMKVLDIEHASTRDMELFRSQAQDLKRVHRGARRRERRLDQVLTISGLPARHLYPRVLAVPQPLPRTSSTKLTPNTAAKIEADSLAYREYTECYDASRQALPTLSTWHFWAASRPLARCSVASSRRRPSASSRPQDEAAEGAGDIGRFNDEQSEKLIEKLHQAKTPDVAPFRQSIMEI